MVKNGGGAKQQQQQQQQQQGADSEKKHHKVIAADSSKVDDDDDDDDKNTNNNDDNALLADPTRPKHAMDGMATGIGLIVKGAVGACGVAILTPIVESQRAQEGAQVQSLPLAGLTGGFVGLFVGASNAASVAAGGVLVGVGQIVRGLAASPSAILEPTRGKWWNANEGLWVLTHLQSEREWIETEPVYDEDILGPGAIPKAEEVVPEEVVVDVDATSSEPVAGIATAEVVDVVVKDMQLYDLLGVASNATKEEINRRYYQKARTFQPTRAGAGTAKAEDKLQEIGNAFVVLTNSTLRQQYDRYGVDEHGVLKFSESSTEPPPLLPKVDPLELFGMLYGSEKFGHLFGRLAAATAATVGEKESSRITSTQARLLQRRRVTRLALILSERLQKWFYACEKKDDESDVSDLSLLIIEWQEEAQDLCAGTSYGVKLVHLIGWAYTACARHFLGSLESGIGRPSIQRWVQKQQADWQARGLTLLRDVETFATGTRDDKMRRQLQKGVAEDMESLNFSDGGHAMCDDLYSRMGSSVLDMLWTQTVLDVSNTLHETIKMVLFDQDKNAETRKIMAEGLESLGQVMLDVDYVEPSEEVRQQQSDHERMAFYGVLETVYVNDNVAHETGP